jgi:NAD(P)-dependent dehydrogenase (short-subunit alcohol dehydrogenase family)
MSTKINFSKPISYTTPENKHVLVTGGASRLGEGFVRMFAQAGANVVIADLSRETGLEIEAELVKSGQRFVKDI